MARGLFITGTDTGVGKTYVTAIAARCLAEAGRRVGVYKPVASGCRWENGELVSDDALALWQAAGRPAPLERVCPQRVAAPLAPHLAARAEGKRVDERLLRQGLDFWLQRSDVVLVEGAGGYLSPLGEHDCVADLAGDFGFPLVVVTRNALGTINHTLQTLLAVAAYAPPLACGKPPYAPPPVAGLVLNDVAPHLRDESAESNRRELEARCAVPLLAQVAWQAQAFDRVVDWFKLAAAPGLRGWSTCARV